MSDVVRAALLVSFPVVAAAAGAGVASWRRPGPRLTSGIQHFAAGVVLAALVGEVLPDLRSEGQWAWASAGFAAGVALVLTLAAQGRRVDAGARERGGRRLPIGLLVAVGIDLLLDGLLVGLGVRLGTTQAVVLTVALTLEISFLMLSLAGELRDNGFSAAAATGLCTGLGAVTAVGAIGGALVFGGVGPAGLAFVLAFGAAALLYLSVEELLAEAHEAPESTALTAMFFVGFLVVYALSALGG